MKALRRFSSVVLSLLIVLGAPGLPAYQAFAADINVNVPAGVQTRTVVPGQSIPQIAPINAELTQPLSAATQIPQLPTAQVSAAAPTAEIAVPQIQPEATLNAVPAVPSSPEAAAPRSLTETVHDLAASLPERLAAPFGAAVAPETLAETNLEVDPAREYYPSPADWRDEIMYSVMMDRFNRSPEGKSYGDVKDGVSRHGGDIKGLTQKLDYIKDLGVTSIILSPVVLNLPDSYHGYAPIHFMAIDPHMGTMADFKELVAEAHKRGIKIIMDWVTNHSGPVFEYKDGSKWNGLDHPAKEIGEWTAPLYPKELANPDNFTRHGVIDNWNDHDQATNGDFPPNYRHFAGNNPKTQDLLVQTVLWWMKETDIDGVRLDAIRHFAPGLLPRLASEMRAYAAKLGKKNFFILGENSTGVDSEITPFLGEHGIDSAYNYPAYRRENYALHGQAPTSELENSLHKSQAALGPAAGEMLRFIDNHDTYRFLRAGEPVSILKLAFAYLYYSLGIPLVYYGTEQAFRQAIQDLGPENPLMPADPRNREDMWAEGQFKSSWSAGDKFDTNSEVYKFASKLAEVRKAYPALSRGEQYMRWSDTNGAGISAFSRIYKGQEVVVVMNTSSETRSAEMWVDSGVTPAGTALADALDASYTVSTHAPAEGGSKLTVQVPPHGVRVLVRK
jgi:glycosidase